MFMLTYSSFFVKGTVSWQLTEGQMWYQIDMSPFKLVMGEEVYKFSPHLFIRQTGQRLF